MRGYAGEVKNTAKEKIQNQVVLFELMCDPSRSLEYNELRDNDVRRKLLDTNACVKVPHEKRKKKSLKKLIR